MKERSFKIDFAYKFIKPTSFINKKEAPEIVIPLWRSNRLSLIRGYIFLESFFKDVQVNRKTIIRIKYKRADKKMQKKTVYFFHINIRDPRLFIFLGTYLPEPKVISTKLGYVIIYPFHNFTLQVPVDMRQPIFSYRILPYLKLFLDAKVY